MAKVTLQGHIIVPDADLHRVKRELVTHIKLTKQEAGCLAFNISPDGNNPNKFDVFEVFVSQKAFDFHQARVKVSNWGKVSANVQRHYRITTDE